MRRGTISWGLASGTAVAAKARKKLSSPLNCRFRSSSGQCCALSVRLPEARSPTGVLLDSKEATLGLQVQLLCTPVHWVAHTLDQTCIRQRFVT